MPGSGNVLVDAIAGIGWLNRGGDRNITFFFDNSFGFHNWTAGEKDAFQAALQQYANVANITIQQVGSSAGADLSERWVSDAYMRANFGDFAGFHEFPKSSPPAGGAYNFDGRPYYTASGLAAGGLGFEVFLHEIGHGLGLAHPHDTAMGTGLLPGVTSESSLGTLGYNQGLYTVMSYNDGPALSSGSNNYGHAATPMAFDIAAMQFLYGANNGYRTGADIYVIPDANAPARRGSASGMPAGRTRSPTTGRATSRSTCAPPRSSTAIRTRAASPRGQPAFSAGSRSPRVR